MNTIEEMSYDLRNHVQSGSLKQFVSKDELAAILE